ncbi:hypothetical protein H9Q73_011198 [Fusarium xylarioides]|nr:hypothetical protein H9Q73_011198 [Fusarium xylarioides]
MAPPERRILLPKLAAEAPGENDQVLPAASKRRALPPRRRNASVACQSEFWKAGNTSGNVKLTNDLPACRRRKVKCGGARPKCHQCEKASIDCVYDTPAGFNRRQADKDQIARLQATVEHLRQRTSTQSTPNSDQPGTSLSPRPPAVGNIRGDVQSSEDLVELLRDQPEAFALQALECLRQGRSPKETMDSIGGNLSTNINPSIHAAARGSVTPTQTPLEFQLVVQYPQVYLPLAPLDAASPDLGLLGIEPQNADIFQNPGLSNLLHDSVSTVAVNRVVRPREVLGGTSFGADNSIFIDPRLHHVDISPWTSIPISNKFAAEAIALYLNMNQPWWAYFDTDLFLDDLVNVEINFCSSMLVNALLAWATVSLRNPRSTFVNSYN